MLNNFYSLTNPNISFSKKLSQRVVPFRVFTCILVFVLLLIDMSVIKFRKDDSNRVSDFFMSLGEGGKEI